MSAMRELVAGPVLDYLAVVEAMRDRGVPALLCTAIALAATWFAYVPVHELLHAWGCMLAGGEVTRLEIAPEYGGAWLARIFPWVVAGSSYAGQLTGFDTHGNDAIYLATVLAPFLLTIAIGVPLLKHLARPSANAASRPWLLGVAALLAYAPLVSLMGDYYEAGSIIVSRAVHAFDPSLPLARWRSDDFLLLVATLRDAGASIGDWAGVVVSLLAGFLLALLTYRVGALVSRRLSDA